MRLADILFSQGFGTRRICAGLVAGGHVQIAGDTCRDPAALFDTNGLTFVVDGTAWPYHRRALIMLHKPAGYECSQKPKHHPSVYSLLPAPLRTRGVQAVGRLDADTTGLLLFTDDGALLHRWTSPKAHVEKRYVVSCRYAVTPAQRDALLLGVVLSDDPVPVRASRVTIDSDSPSTSIVELGLTQGKYHQVKRMISAVGNRVESLHRCAFGELTLSHGLSIGDWTWVAAPQGKADATRTAGLHPVGLA